jgi:hypothetical protein
MNNPTVIPCVYAWNCVLPYSNATFADVGADATGAFIVDTVPTAQYGALAALSLFPQDDILFSF